MKLAAGLIWLVFFLIAALTVKANGVAVIDGSNATYMELIESDVQVHVTNQIATITTTQVFENNTADTVLPKYGFPMPEDGSATLLQFKIDTSWFLAEFTASPQDTTLPGTGGGSTMDPYLAAFLGETPLYFDPELQVLPHQTITVELTYVQLLGYNNNWVSFHYPANYAQLQPQPVDHINLEVTIESDRTITQVNFMTSWNATISNNGNTASIQMQQNQLLAGMDYEFEYELDPSQLGLIGFSTFIPDSLLECDALGSGFFGFIVEPDATGNTQVINKVFTLIIDRSGSMGGQKMNDAKETAKFFVQNLNQGDRFNIVDFASNVNSFQTNHVYYDANTEADAIAYINNLYAGGGTNARDAFSEAIPQFANISGQVANVIIFITDGHANSGTAAVIDRVNDLVAQYNIEDLNLFAFGIGSGANKQLLSQLASQHNGMAGFMDVDDMQTTLANFYLAIRNPVLLNTTMQFTVTNISSASYPNPLPNLYKGQQLLVVGRYSQPDSLGVTMMGEDLNGTVSYPYQFNLVDSMNVQYNFLTKIWAKKKIENLLTKYYNLDAGTPQAAAVKQEVIDVSMCYRVLSPFTSFIPTDQPGSGGNGGGPGGGGGGGPLTVSIPELESMEYEQTGELTIFPNPFQAFTTITFDLGEQPTSDQPVLEIYDIYGRLICILSNYQWEQGQLIFNWDGTAVDGLEVNRGLYLVQLQMGNERWTKQVTKL